MVWFVSKSSMPFQQKQEFILKRKESAKFEKDKIPHPTQNLYPTPTTHFRNVK